METNKIINSHNSWSPLEEVWLGDIYPAAWYDHLPTEIRDVFQELTEITQQDLNSIQRTLESFGVTVQRPQYDRIDDYVDDASMLIKPEICPRDTNVVIGNTLYRLNHRYRCWDHVLRQYPSVKFAPHSVVNGANVVRAGRDIVIDTDVYDWQYQNEFPEYRVRLVKNGGHMDGCFAILKPGLILANHYFDDYETTFPGWEVIMLDNPTYGAAPSRGYAQPYPVYNGKFWDTTVGTNNSFNQHIVQHALDWVGDYTETYFELNCLVVDENNVLMPGENHQLAEDLSRRGITVHWVPFRTRSFWDGGVHCLTVDIRRQSSIVDYFPERNS
jgi:hypothetical protein